MKDDGADMRNKGRTDLHIHTTVSDGTDTPEALLERVRETKLILFSVTDHDAIKASRIIPALLEEGDPLFISGAEFSCRDEAGKYHILGYGYDPDGEAIRQTVEKGHRLRMEKVLARLDFLKTEYGFTFSPEELENLLALDNPGKPHIAKLMIEHGYAETIDDAIRHYIDRIRSPISFLRPEEAIRGILGSGGVPVLAHPSYGSGDEIIVGGEMEERVRRLTGFGLQGLEAYYSGFTGLLIGENLALRCVTSSRPFFSLLVHFEHVIGTQYHLSILRRPYIY